MAGMAAALLVLVLSCAACANTPVTPGDATPTAPRAGDASLEQTIELPAGATAPVPGTSVTITFVRVASDSRCPRGVTCIWAGDAVVQLRLQPREGEAQPVELHTSQGGGHEATVESVTVSLERLDPYPEPDRPIAAERYVVTLNVRVQ
jgi:hypothetical protein